MKIELELLQTIVIGSFNPAIVTPDWLREQKIVHSDSDDAMAYSELSDGASFFAGGFEWLVDYSQLSVSSVDADKNCGEMVARVIKELPHTPVEAVGHNFHYTCQKLEWEGPEPQLNNRQLVELGADEVRWDARFAKPDGWVEVTLRIPSSNDDYVVIMLNYHHIVDGATVSARSISAQKSAQMFENDRNDAAKVLSDLFQIS